MQLQPVINVGTTGHVANGKSTLVKCLSDKETQQFSKEKERNITIRLGYANTKIWKCNECEEPQCFSSSQSSVMEKQCKDCGANCELVNHISIVDCPGHRALTSTMLNGSCVMDYTMLVEACNNQTIPAPQTAEHLAATRAAKIPTTMIAMNKIDIVDRKTAYSKIGEITDYYREHFGGDSALPPIIPMSATFNINVDVMCQYISQMQVPKERDRYATFKMIVIRSFDINKPGVDVTELNGGVIGGTIMRGTLKVGDRINIYPGNYRKIPECEKKKEGADFRYQPLSGEVLSIMSDKNSLDSAIPGGLLGIQLTIDPKFTRNDELSGSLVLRSQDVENDDEEKLFKIYDKIIVQMSTFIMDESEVTKALKKSDTLEINVNSNNVDCEIRKYSKSKKQLFLLLNKPIAIDSSENLATIISKDSSRDIMGRGVIIDGVKSETWD